jgi:hypothetical protein
MNFTEEQKNFLLELIEKESDRYMNVRCMAPSFTSVSVKNRWRGLKKLDTPTSAAFKRFAEKLKKELSNE